MATDLAGGAQFRENVTIAWSPTTDTYLTLWDETTWTAKAEPRGTADSDTDELIAKIDELATTSLEFAVDAFHPLLLLRSYLCKCEVLLLKGNCRDAVAHWLECKHLFNSVLSDGVSVPLLRIASVPMVARLEGVVQRMVRCLVSMPGSVVNAQLATLDLLLHTQADAMRARRRPRQRPPLELVPRDRDAMHEDNQRSDRLYEQHLMHQRAVAVSRGLGDWRRRGSERCQERQHGA